MAPRASKADGVEILIEGFLLGIGWALGVRLVDRVADRRREINKPATER